MYDTEMLTKNNLLLLWLLKIVKCSLKFLTRSKWSLFRALPALALFWLRLCHHISCQFKNPAFQSAKSSNIPVMNFKVTSSSSQKLPLPKLRNNCFSNPPSLSSSPSSLTLINPIFFTSQLDRQDLQPGVASKRPQGPTEKRTETSGHLRLSQPSHRSRDRAGWARSGLRQWTGSGGCARPLPGCWFWAATWKKGQ